MRGSLVCDHGPRARFLGELIDIRSMNSVNSVNIVDSVSSINAIGVAFFR